MESRQITELRKVTRNLSDITAPDGSFLELINLRFKDGVLRPVPSKVRTAISPQVKILFKHVISPAKYVLLGINTVGGNHLAYYYYLNGVMQTEYPTFLNVSGTELAFSPLGLTLTVSDITAETTFVLVFSNDTNTYTVYNDLTPEMPFIDVRHVRDAGQDSSNRSADFPIDDSASWSAGKVSEYCKMVDEKTSKGVFVGTYLVRFAWELFDGRIVRPSLPMYVLTGVVLQSSTVYYNGTYFAVYWTTDFDFWKPQFAVSLTSGEISDLKTKYKDYVKSLNVYITRTYKPGIEEGTLEKMSKYEVRSYFNVPKNMNAHVGKQKVFRTNNPTVDVNYTPDVKSETYYLLKSIPVNDLATGWQEMNDKTITDIMYRDFLPVDEFTHHSLYGRILFTYNDRIFMGNIKNRLYKGFSPTGMVKPISGGTTGSNYDVGMEFDIQTIDGLKTVFTGWVTYNYTYPTYDYAFRILSSDTFTSVYPIYWGYPDHRAIACRILLKDPSANVRLVKTWSMTCCQDQNFSHTNLDLLNDSYLGVWATPPIYVQPTGKTTYWDENRVQASELRNPFSYPAMNSYRLQGIVKGLASNAAAISQGQFGQYPIFCFTDQGIWAMNIGLGEALIDSITPLSRLVLANEKSILMIEGGVAFVAEEGLVILSGQNPVEISEEAEREYRSPMWDTVAYENIVNNPNTYQVKPYLSGEEFKTYLAGAILGYNHQESEIIVCNPSKNHSWIFNIVTKSWYKITHRWDSFFPSYPKWIGCVYEDVTWYLEDLSQENKSISEVIMIHAETRPFKFNNPSNPKALKRIQMLGNIDNAPESPFGIHLFGSNDGKEYYLHAASTFLNPNESLTIGRSTFSCKFYIFIFGGNVLDTSNIAALAADVEHRYTNKIR